MSGDKGAQREYIIEIPGTVDGEALSLQCIQVIQDASDNAYVLAETLLIGAVAAIGVVEVNMKARAEVDLPFVSRFHTTSVGIEWQSSITIAEDIVLSNQKGVFHLEVAHIGIGSMQ